MATTGAGAAAPVSVSPGWTPTGFRVGVAAILVAFVALAGWNFAHTSWLRGYDAFDVARYSEIVAFEHRLPRPDEVDIWHNPPLYFAVAGTAERVTKRFFGVGDSYRGAQLLSVGAAVGVVLLAFLTARSLFPESPTAQLGALGLAAATPVLVRGAVMYHPEPLMAALAALAIYLVVRALARGRVTVGAAALAGAVAGLASLTRTWGFAVIAALGLVLALDGVRARRAWPAVAFLAVALALAAPWLAYKWDTHGSPLAFSTPGGAEQWPGGGRDLSFYTTVAAGELVRDPYEPHFRNRLLPVTYADWWGDWHRSFRVPDELRTLPERLPDEYRGPLVWQSLAGLVPTVLLLAGVVGLAVTAVRRRSLELLAVLAPLGLLVASYVFFLARYPKTDGDNIKALYLLSTVAPLAVCGGWALAQVRRAGTLAFAGVLLLLAAFVYSDLAFLVLPA